MNILKIEQGGNSNGTSLKGSVNANYNDLVKVFGEPTYKAEESGGMDKVWTEWDIDFEVADEFSLDDPDASHRVQATIYDWKESGPYVAREANSYRWHVGGFDYEAEDAVQTALLDYLAKAV
jgi:hypothetical protein